MKLDNPKLTAYALGELSPAEQAELERELKFDREVAAEVEETREIARILRAGLGAEPSGDLADFQRDAIFREARVVAAQKAGSAAPANEMFAPLIVPKSPWWNRPGPWQAVAACAVAGFAAYALLMNVGNNGQTSAGSFAQNGEILVRIPVESGPDGATAKMPDLVSPNGQPAAGGIAPAGIDPLKNVASVSRGPRVIGNEPGAELRAGASIGRPQKKADEDLAEHLKERLAEAAELRPGVSFADFSKLFQPSGKPGQYEMIRVPSVKVDAEFSTLDGQRGLSGESELQRVSKPYLE